LYTKCESKKQKVKNKEKRMVFLMKLGFIGTGNMASAIMGGIIKNQIIPAEEIIGADLFAPGREKAKEQFKIHVTDSNKEVVEKADVIVLSVKPQFYADVIAEIKDGIKAEQIVITIAPGKTLAWLSEQFGKDVKIVRTMPNTPAMVGEGMTAACPNEHMTEEETAYVRTLLESFGKVEIVPERLMDTVVSVSGSSPAYVFMLIEAMADAAVSGGMPRPQAYQFAAQAVLGSAKMVLETGKHPGELKDMVCSPAGTTIEAVRVLEERGFRSAVFEAMKVCEEISKGM
jgi:pyrroline-5-carboxylate reductase